MYLGIIFGLAAAFCQSLSYLSTRYYVQKRVAAPPGGSGGGVGGGSRQLLVLSHVWMGLFALLVIPFAWPAGGIHFLRILSPLLCNALFYLAGQVGLMIALKHTEPSRVSPLLGIKIVILALIASFIRQPDAAAGAAVGLTLIQWAAVILCVFAAVSLNFSGATLSRRAVVAILFTCLFYSISDWNIGLLVNGLRVGTSMSFVHAAVLGGCLSYLVTALCVIGFLPRFGARRAADWRDAVPFAVTWFSAMLLLFSSFALIGVLFGNILQSTRGLMSILMASLLIKLGHHHLESHATRAVLLRRLASGALMFLAVLLYALKDRAGIHTLLTAMGI